MKLDSSLILLLAAACAVACSEAADPEGPGATSSSGSGASSAATTSSPSSSSAGGSSSASTTGAGGGGVNLDGLVFNEIRADGEDWIELFNTGAAAVDLTGVRIADDDAGAPKLDEAVDLSGAIVEPGAYLFVLADLATPGMGEQTMCAPGPSPCWHTGWGISHPNGDVIYLVGAGDAILLQQDYPAAGAPAASWGRLPNGSGNFVITQPTPGAENLAP